MIVCKTRDGKEPSQVTNRSTNGFELFSYTEAVLSFILSLSELYPILEFGRSIPVRNTSAPRVLLAGIDSQVTNYFASSIRKILSAREHASEKALPELFLPAVRFMPEIHLLRECFWQESNLHFLLRREISYPLNDRSKILSIMPRICEQNKKDFILYRKIVSILWQVCWAPSSSGRAPHLH